MRLHLPTLALLVLLLTLTHSRRRKEQLAEQTQTKEERKTVVEANHFYSNQETNSTYEVNSVEKDKPLILYLKPKSEQIDNKALKDNPITITLNAGSDSVTCNFTSYSNLCSIPKVSASDVKLKLACKKAPCEMSWDLFQPPTQEQDGDHSLDSLVAVNQQSQHAVLRVFCNNPDLRKTFGDSIKLYSNSLFRKFTTLEGMVYFLFSNEQKGYYYLTTDDDKARSCANASVMQVIETVDFNPKTIITDFTSPFETNVYEFSKVPDSDFRVQFSAHDGRYKQLTNTTGMKIGLIGYKSGERKQISVVNLAVDDQKTYIDFSMVYKKPSETYDKMELELKGFGTLLVVQMKFYISAVQDVEMGEESYFDLKKGEKISYKMVALPKDAKPIDKINIYTFEETKFKTNVSSCGSTGCQFTLEALESGQGNIYIGESATRNTTEMIIEEFTSSITKTIRQGEYSYFSYKMKGKQAIQLLINSPSVMAFAAAKSKCDKVEEEKDCVEKTFNSHNPAIYEPQVDQTLLIKVVALDNCDFTLTVLDSHTQFIEIKDAVPFTYLMDDKESFLYFTFKLTTKQDVSFNLIAPVNELVLYVINKEKVTQEDKDKSEISSNGYIKFEKADIKQLVFRVQVQKREEYRNKYVHFTLIASTKEGNLRLQPGVAHYQTLQPKDSRDYVFEFEPKKAILLNFYTHNIKENVNIGLKISNADEYAKDENTADLTIDQEVDVLDIALISKKLCKQAEGENCELFVRMKNQMDVETDVTVTLMMKDAIIELKDGIWQNYATTVTSASSHFYFLPKHQNHSTTVFYKSSLVDLKIMYSLWQSDDWSIDPSQWPFPDQYKENEKLSELTFKPIDFIHIDAAQLKACWPYCVVLMSIAPDINAFKSSLSSLSKQSLESLKTSGLLNAQFKIMASNNYIELPEKHKVDIVLVKDEEKELLVDLKYYLEKEALTFNTYVTIGHSQIKANLYSESNPRCPNNDDDGDFTFESMTTQIKIEDIKSKMADNSMEDDRDVSLCILVQAKTDTKFSIQFTSDAEAIKTLTLDSSYTLRSVALQETFYQIDSTQQFELKITRNEGFPFMATKLCKPGKDMDSCVQQFLDSGDEKGIQLADKVSDVSGSPCPQCLMLVKITSQQPSEVLLHVQSRYTQVELVENSVMSDDIEPNEQNRYTLTGTKNQQIIINVQITSGNLRVQVHDFQLIDITKTNAAGSKNIHITIPSKDLNTKAKDLGVSHMSAFGLSTFVHLHITVESQDSKEKALYSITYSSGDPTVYLQDGLITEYNLITKKNTKFIYKNPTNQGIYVHVSTTDTQSLNKLSLKMYAMDNPEDEDSQIEMTPQKPDFKKKTPNPTMLMQLPAKKTYLISVTNNNDKDTIFTIGINNREIIYLPFDHEFPVQLKAKEYIYVVVSTASPGYVKISFSKCDESEPFIGYTQDYSEFIQEDYSTQEQMSDELMQELIVKVKDAGGIYLKIRSPDDDSSLMTIKASFSPNKITLGRAKAGDKGLMQYQLLDSTKAELTFTSLVCGSDKNCNKDFAYSSLSSNKIQNVYAQLVCPSIVFDLEEVQQLKSADLTPITSSSAKNNKMTFTQAIKGEIEYVGVKAFNSKTGDVVYYRPVEIVTFWGELHRTSKATLFLGSVLIFAFLMGILLIYRRWKKQEYRPLGESNDINE